MNKTLIRHFRLDRSVVDGHGARVQLDDGTTAIDVIAGYGAMPFGTCPRLPFASITTPAFGRPFDDGPEVRRLATTLMELYGALGPQRGAGVLFAQSGTQAVQIADQVACFSTGNDVVAGLCGGFHGRLGVAAALSALADRPPFYYCASGRTARHVAPGEALERVDAVLNDGVSALFLELVQGETGGMRVLNPDWVADVLQIARAHQVVTIVDEIQTGLGRTGALLASGSFRIQPDVLLLGKALGAGLHPLSAVVVGERCWDDRLAMAITSTFDQPRLAASAASFVLDVVGRPGFLRDVRRRGERLESSLNRLIQRHPDALGDRRGRCLMQSLEVRFRGDSQLEAFAEATGLATLAVCGWLLENGVRAAPCAGDYRRLRMTPPLTIEDEQIDLVVAVLDELAQVLRRPGAAVDLLAGMPPLAPIAKSA